MCRLQSITLMFVLGQADQAEREQRAERQRQETVRFQAWEQWMHDQLKVQHGATCAYRVMHIHPITDYGLHR